MIRILIYGACLNLLKKACISPPHLTNSLKVIALSELIEKHQPKKLTLLSSNNELKRRLKSYALIEMSTLFLKKYLKKIIQEENLKLKTFFINCHIFLEVLYGRFYIF